MPNAATETVDRVTARRDRTRAAILDASWELAAESGLDALSLREIGTRVGMRAPSLYSYFPSKAAILDALFAQGYRAFTAQIDALEEGLDQGETGRDRMSALLRGWLRFCQAHPARYRLMFTSAVPGWQPSPEAYTASLTSYERMRRYLVPAGVTAPADLDLATALGAGLIAQQMANDPNGDRWLRLVDDVVDMFVHHLASRGTGRPTKETR